MKSITQIRQLIADSRLEDALQEMQKLASSKGDNRLGNTLTLLSGQFNSNERNNRIGLLTPADYGRTRNRISFSLLEMLNDIDDGATSGNDSLGSTPDQAVEPTVTPQSDFTKIVFLAANPLKAAKLQLQKEYGLIVSKLEEGDTHTQFQTKYRYRVTPTEFLQYLQVENPHILHFSGHGAKAGEVFTRNAATRAGRSELNEAIAVPDPEAGILLLNEDKDGPHQVSTSFLARTFRTAQRRSQKKILAVIFNACNSEEQAKAVGQYVPYVIGTDAEVGDDAAIAFAQSFYFSLAQDKENGNPLDIASAVDLGITNAMANGESEERFMLFKDGKKVDVNDLFGE